MGRKEFLFEHYRQNLNKLLATDSRLQMEPARDDIIICPLCFNRFFTFEDIVSGLLTAEHAPPSGLGGTVDTLTCRTCNHNHGSMLDSEIVKYIQNEDALSGFGPTYVDARAHAEEGLGPFRAEFRITENGWVLLGVPKASNRRHIEDFTDRLRSGERKFTLTFILGNERRARLSLIRSAYLIAFRDLGYGFLVNSNLERLRQQFNNPDEDIFPIQAALFKFDCPDEFLGINIVSKPKEMKCYFIVFDIQAKGSMSHRVAVMLPGPNTKDYEMFERLDSFSNETITINNFTIQFDEKLGSPWLAHELWDMFE